MKKNSTKIYSAFIGLAVLFSSCSKIDNNYDYKKMPTTIELPLAAHAGPAAYDNGGFKWVLADSISATPQALTTTVLISTINPLKKDVKVTLTVDNAALARLNAAHRALYLADSTTAVTNATALPDPTASQYTVYQAMPANAFTIPSSTVTIPAGQLTANYNINIISANLTPLVKYMLPVSITDAQGQTISYYRSVLYVISTKNKYEGDYTANGSISFPDPTLNRSWTGRDKFLTTVNANTVVAEAADLGGSNYFMNLTVNSDNTVTVVSASGAANKTIQNNGTCVYDPATRTFTLNYKYIGGTGDRVIAETISEN
ncbi:BT_3987 domain-containing protein [Mucilaginibacter sp.]|uniref:BT_3987 domain-containing protein n=1 Tax=Mucilaginibacter sp. TaxID=1882438 RepID=UPI003D0EFB65